MKPTIRQRLFGRGARPGPYLGDVYQGWPGKGFFQKPGPWCRTKNAFKIAAQSHQFELYLSIALMLFGVRALTNLQAAPNSINDQPEPVAVVYCLLSVFGGGLTLVGLLANVHQSGRALCLPGEEQTTTGRWGAGIEQAGLYFSAGAWVSYLIGVVGTVSTANITLLGLALTAMAVANVSRAIDLARAQQHRLDTIRALKSVQDRA